MNIRIRNAENIYPCRNDYKVKYLLTLCDFRSESLQEALWLAVLLYKGLNRVSWYMLT